MRENRDKWLFTKIGIMSLLLSYLIIGISNLIIINQRIEELGPKLIVFGEVREMDYWNITVEDVNFMFNTFGDERNITVHFYNLTIFNFLTFSNVVYGFECSIVKAYKIQINSFLIIRERGPFIDLEVYNEGFLGSE